MLELQLDLPSGTGRRAALEAELRAAIREGRLVGGAALPSTRVMAADLGVSRSTVVAAYEQLTTEGYLIARPGSATSVAKLPVHGERTVDEPQQPFGARPRWDWRPGEPDASAFPRQEWMRSLRRVLTEAPDIALGYPDPRGTVELRSALADYLARARTVHASADSIRIRSGITGSLGLLVETLRSIGITRLAVEDPMFIMHAIVLRRSGIEVVSVPVDEEGICVTSLAEMGVGAVLVTPANQFPLGVTMTSARRTELMVWARECDAWIIEDDYDGEFRYDRRPIGSLQGLAPDRVVYAGTSTKALVPALRMSWLVVPEGLLRTFDRFASLRVDVGVIDQLALADFIERGQLDRQIRIMRKRYHDRSQKLRDALSSIEWLEATAVVAGLHVPAMIVDDSVSEADVLARTDAASVGIFGLSTHSFGRRDTVGLIIGFSRPPEHEFARSLEHLATALAEVRRL